MGQSLSFQAHSLLGKHRVWHVSCQRWSYCLFISYVKEMTSIKVGTIYHLLFHSQFTSYIYCSFHRLWLDCRRVLIGIKTWPPRKRLYLAVYLRLLGRFTSQLQNSRIKVNLGSKHSFLMLCQKWSLIIGHGPQRSKEFGHVSFLINNKTLSKQKAQKHCNFHERAPYDSNTSPMQL